MCKFNNSDFEQQIKQIWDSSGNRYIKCEICGKIKSSEAFAVYGGINRVNLGKCRDCVYRSRHK